MGTQIKKEVECCLNKDKSFENMVKSTVLLETVNDKERLTKNLKTKAQSLDVTNADLLNELPESYNTVSHVSILKFKLQIFIKAKSTDEVIRVENDARPSVILPKFKVKNFSEGPLKWNHSQRYLKLQL